VEAIQRRALEVAKAIIGGRISLVHGVRELAGLRSVLCRDPLSSTFLPILAAADDTRDLHLARSIHLTDKLEAEDLTRQIDEAERLHRATVLDACRTLVQKLESERE
jgi:hypothetical protein